MCQNLTVGPMKTLARNLIPAIHINPINRDLVLVVMTALVVAIVMVTAGMMVFSQI